MDTFNRAIDLALGAIYKVFAWSPGLGLAVISAAAGVAMLWIFGKTSNQQKIRAVKRLVQAFLMELRIYADEPAIVWQSQKALVATNLRYLGLMLRPALVTAVPLAILLVHLEGFYGRAPLPVGEETTVTMALRGPMAEGAPVPELEAPPEIVVETAGCRHARRTAGELGDRPQAPVSGHLAVRIDGAVVETAIEAGEGPRRVPGAASIH